MSGDAITDIKPNLREIDAIIFDLGGVLLNIDYGASTAAMTALSSQDPSYSQHHQSAVFDQFERGEISAEAFRAGLRQAFGMTASDERIDAAWNAMLLDLPEHRVALLRALAKKWRIFLLSNTNEIHKENFDQIVSKVTAPQSFDELFEASYYSHLIGARKPEAAAFARVCEDNRLSPGRTLFIDDTIGHVIGARAFGLHAYHLEDDIVSVFQSWLSEADHALEMHR